MVAEVVILSLGDALWWTHYASLAPQRPSDQCWVPPTTDEPLLVATANVNALGPHDPVAPSQAPGRQVNQKRGTSTIGR